MSITVDYVSNIDYITGISCIEPSVVKGTYPLLTISLNVKLAFCILIMKSKQLHGTDTSTNFSISFVLI